MYLELENKFIVIDLRTEEGVLDYIKKYDVDIPQLDDEDNYFRGSLYYFKEESGMSDEEIANMLFEMEDEDEMYIEHTYYTDCGRTITLESKIGDISYFECIECDYEPDYPYVDKINEDEFYKKIKPMKEFLSKLDKMNEGE